MGKLQLLIMNVLVVFLYGACQLPQRPPQSSTNESKHKAQDLPSNVTFFGGGRSKEMSMVSGKTDTIFISVHQADSVLIKLPRIQPMYELVSFLCPMVRLMAPLAKSLPIDLKMLAKIILR